MAERQCRRCLLMEAFPEDYARYVESLLGRMRPAERVPGDEYQKRLAVCRACEQLDRGTCMGCGCLVELRAARRGEHCPFRRW